MSRVSYFEYENFVYRVTEENGRAEALVFDIDGKSSPADAEYILLNGDPITEAEFNGFFASK